MPHDARAVANLILDLAEELEIPFSTLALQKIMFFCHGYWLAKHDSPLITQLFEAWKRGPVLRTVYDEFKSTKRGEKITERAYSIDLVTEKREVAKSYFSQEEEDHIKHIIEKYGRISSFHLMELTHIDNGPWDKVRNEKIFSTGGIIENFQIRDYFCNLSAVHFKLNS